MASCSIATSLSRLSLLRLIPKPSSSSYSSSIPLFPTTTRKVLIVGSGGFKIWLIDFFLFFILSPCSCSLQDPSRFRLFSASMASEPKESPSNNQGLHSSPDEATKGYFMQQTMYRIKDPKVSLDFYSRVLGMSLLKRLDFPEMKFSLYFMGYEDTASAPSNETERTVWTFSQKATIELTHNWGTESDPDFKGYHNGNSEPRGFGHIGITVDDTYKACERFEHLGVEFVKKPDDGKMKGIAFIKDPDGYWIEIFDLRRIGTVSTTAA